MILTEWHSWFAWYPVRTQTGWTWMQWVNRKLHRIEHQTYERVWYAAIYEHRKKK